MRIIVELDAVAPVMHVLHNAAVANILCELTGIGWVLSFSTVLSQADIAELTRIQGVTSVPTTNPYAIDGSQFPFPR